MSFFDRFNNKDLSVVVSEVLVATADASDETLDETVTQVLKALRDRLYMDVVFVSEFVDGKRVFRYVDALLDDGAMPRAGGYNLLEESWCQRVIDGRLPEMVKDISKLAAESELPRSALRIGAHLSTPVILSDGRTYGTLCTFSAEPKSDLQERDLTTLRLCARLVARKIDVAMVMGRIDPAPDAPSQEIKPVQHRRPVW